MLRVDRARAKVFRKLMSHGRNQPAVFHCDIPGGDARDYVVKFRHQLGASLASELIASLLAQALHLPVPAPAIVEIGTQLAKSRRELPEELVLDPGPHFGCEMAVGGYVIFDGDIHIPAHLVELAFDIFAWDVIIQNEDRRREKPNMLTNGENFLIIDHELSLGFDQTIGSPREPWKLHGSRLVRDHVLRTIVHKNATANSFDSFLERLSRISDAHIDEIFATVPPEWQSPFGLTKTNTYLKDVCCNTDKCRVGLLGVIE